MLAALCDDPTKLRFPVWATPKIDGIRALILGGNIVARSLKPIPNRHIQRVLGISILNGLDGELDLHRKATFQEVSSEIMSNDGEPAFVYRVFDVVAPVTYVERMVMLAEKARVIEHLGLTKHFAFLFPTELTSLSQLELYAASCLAQGYEGAMIRTAASPYKYGRSTFKEQYLVKIKPTEDDEGVIVGFDEQMQNANEATVNALGRTERSHHKAGMIPKGTLGALRVKSELWKGSFGLGSGLTDALKAQIWGDLSSYLGKTVKYRYQKIGSKDLPRQPVFLGFRDAIDS